MQNIINFYKQFDRYDTATPRDLYFHIKPSFDLGQYKIFEESGEIYGFANWAWVNDKVHADFLKTGIIENWSCGDKMLYIDFVASRNIKHMFSWLLNQAADILGPNQTIYWVRLAEDSVRTVVKHTTKDN